MFGFFKSRMISIEVDGKKLKTEPGITILEAAKKLGIEIPTLCYVKDIQPTGGCRVCVVEVQGSRTLVGSCHTPITDGMVIQTDSPRVLAVRKTVVELMLTAHTGECVNDPNADHCGLHNLAADHQAGAPLFNVRKPRLFAVEEVSPYIRRDLSKCILCRKCVVACREIAKKDILSVGYRGFKSKVVTDCDDVLNNEVCKDCGVCIEHCPTGAMGKPVTAGR